MTRLAERTVLLVGAGGLGCPAGRVLAKAGVGRLIVVDDDTVDGTNLHRQVLFTEEDLGRPKADVAAERLSSFGAEAEPRRTRFLPETADALLEAVDLVVEGTDNFQAKFLVADACAIAQVPVVQAGAVRWGGWALAAPAPSEGPHQTCLRCVFEDVPSGPALSCEFAGVVGPVVGVLGAVQAKLALALLQGDANGALYSYDGRRDRLRKTHPAPRAACPHALGTIDDLQSVDYAPDVPSV